MLDKRINSECIGEEVEYDRFKRTSIDKILSHLNEAKLNGATDVEFEYWHGEENLTVNTVKIIPESEEELAERQRVQDEKNTARAVEAGLAEIREYTRLRKKFDPLFDKKD